jgi:hypothetical protein
MGLDVLYIIPLLKEVLRTSRKVSQTGSVFRFQSYIGLSSRGFWHDPNGRLSPPFRLLPEVAETTLQQI